MQPNEQSKPKKNTARPLGRLGAFLLVTLALLLITLLGVIWVLEKGPSPTITEKFCRSMRETSAIRWIPNIFLSQEEVDAFKSESTENDETETVNTSLIRIAPAAESGTETADDGVELIAITRGTAKGKLLIVRDPSRVILGVSSEEFNAKTPGLQLTELVAKYGGVAGTNAGGFNDENGRGNGGVPQGLVISGGSLLHTAREDERYNVVGFDADHIWSDREKRAFLTAFYTFRTAYYKLSQEPPVTTAEALLVWLHTYTLGDLRVLGPAELEKSIRAVWTELTAYARGGKIEMQTDAEPEASGSGLLGLLAGRMIPGGTLRAAFVHECAPEKSPWIREHDKGRQQLEQALGDAVSVRTYLAADYPCTEDALEQAVSDGAQVIFTTTVPLIFACRKLAPKYPGVRFLNCSVDMPYPGVRTYYGRIYEAKFLLGAIAGALAEDSRIGYVADGPIFGTPAAINAFALGAQLTNPRAEIELRWSCCEASPAARLAEEGLRVICARDLPGSGDSPDWRGLCLAQNAGPVCAALPVWNWGEVYIRLARSILRGGWDELSAVAAVNYWWGFASGAVDVQLMESLPDGPRELVRLLRAALTHGELAPFHRRIADQTGAVQNDGERWLAPEEVLHMDWLCANVRGSIPQYDELLPMARPMVRLLGLYRETLQPEKRGPLL